MTRKSRRELDREVDELSNHVSDREDSELPERIQELLDRDDRRVDTDDLKPIDEDQDVADVLREVLV